MKRIFTSFAVAGFMALFVLNGNAGNVQYSTPDRNDFRLTRHPGSRTGSKFVLSGTTRGDKLLIYIDKDGNRKLRQYFKIRTRRGGRFSLSGGFGNGPGRYTIKIYVHFPEKGGSYYRRAVINTRASGRGGSFPAGIDYNSSISRRQFRLDPIAYVQGDTIRVSGKARYTRVELNVQDMNRKKLLTMRAEPSADGTFRFRIPPVRGKGRYRLVFYCVKGRSYYLGASVTVFSRTSKTASGSMNSPVVYSAQGAGRMIRIKPFLFKQGKTIRIRGKLNIPAAVVRIDKGRRYTLEPVIRDPNGNFVVTHRFRFGPGKYDITFYGDKKLGMNTRFRLLEYNVISTAPNMRPDRQLGTLHYHTAKAGGVRFDDPLYNNSHSVRISGVNYKYDYLTFRMPTGKRGRVWESTLPVKKGRFALTLLLPPAKREYDVWALGSRGTSFIKYIKRRRHINEELFGSIKVRRTSSFAPKKYLNREVVSFIRRNIGKVIGEGICANLITGMFRELGARTGSKNWSFVEQPKHINLRTQRGIDRYADHSLRLQGKPIRNWRGNLKAGDIVQYMCCTFRRPGRKNLRIAGHVSVLYKHIRGNTFLIAHQNVGRNPKVVITKRNFDNYLSGALRFYRPYKGVY